jgi:succinate dehydrogenase (ubiquinone) cytochrome b560 subunit
MPVSEGNAILASQRLNRPTSPHLGIYKPQITWINSALNRITGSILSGGFYLFGVLYLASPLLGIHMESGAMAAAFGALPFIAKASLKFLISLPFTFHSFNGIRHLIWDTGRELTNKAVNMTGWMVVGVTFVSSGFLALFY